MIWSEHALPIIEEDIPTTYKEAKESRESKDWKGAIDEEMNFFTRILLGTCYNFQRKKEDHGHKWVCTEKENFLLQDVRYNARLVAKCYFQY